jgi:hypothetical protein
LEKFTQKNYIKNSKKKEREKITLEFISLCLFGASDSPVAMGACTLPQFSGCFHGIELGAMTGGCGGTVLDMFEVLWARCICIGLQRHMVGYQVS